MGGGVVPKSGSCLYTYPSNMVERTPHLTVGGLASDARPGVRERGSTSRTGWYRKELIGLRVEDRIL